MKRIEFIAPVESMRGNLGSKQALVYAPNNNRAFDSIEGQLNPALNYEPRLIGAKGKRNYFCVKTKSSNHLTTLSKTAMANLGGVGAVYGAIVRDKSQMVFINAQACYHDAQIEGYEGSFRKYLYSYIKDGLDDHIAIIRIETTDHVCQIDNPWYRRYNIGNVKISMDQMVKFWTNFMLHGVTFSIEGVYRGVGWSDKSWQDLIGSYGTFNILNLNYVLISTSSGKKVFIRYGSQFLIDNNGEYVIGTTAPYDGMNYGLTDITPH